MKWLADSLLTSVTIVQSKDWLVCEIDGGHKIRQVGFFPGSSVSSHSKTIILQHLHDRFKLHGSLCLLLCTQTLDKGYHVLEDFYLFKYFIYFTHFFFQIFIVICSFVIMRVRFSALNQETHVWIGRVVKSGVNVFWFLFEKHMAVFKSSVIVGLSVLPPFYRLTFYGYSACKSHFDLLLSRFTQP